MSAFTPRQRTEIYAEISANILALAPVTSSELGEVVDNIAFGVSDQIYEVYVEIQNALQLLKLDTTTGKDLDEVGSEYPDLKPRYEATKATGVVQVHDPAITKISSTVDIGGSNSGDSFLNVAPGAGPSFGTSGQVLVGVRGQANFETFTYDGRTGDQLTSTGDTIDFDHGSGEPVVKTTVGDRTFVGPFNVSTVATAQTPAKAYASTTPLIIYDGEEEGSMDVEANVEGLDGNTPSNTIAVFIGSPPFPGALPNNGAALTNGQAKEKDPDFRARIRQQRQALSTGNIDAVTSALFNANYLGQRVKFAQVVEDPDPTIPSLAYVDDGAGFTPTERHYTSPIVLVDSALGGEKRFFIPSEFRPIVTNDLENAAYVFANITIEKNAVALTQGTGANQYIVQPDRGIIRLNTPLSPGDHLEIVDIRHYTGLLQEANFHLYGKREDRENYPGIVSLGTWVQGRVPASQFVTVQGNVVLDASRSLNEVVNDIKQNILTYINNLGIGNTVVRNRIVALGFVRGVKDFTLLLPVSDVIIPDGTLARSTVGNITVS